MTNVLADKRNNSRLDSESLEVPREYHWTAENFYRVLDAGVFQEPKRLELIHGRIIEKMPQSPLHFALAANIAECLRALLPSHMTVRSEGPIHIAQDGEPIPDVSVVTGKNLDYLRRHPVSDEVLLLVEVAVSSVDYDLGEKALLYAQAGIIDYWVVLPDTQQIVVHRDPALDGYLAVAAVGIEEIMTPLLAPDVTLSVQDLLGNVITQD